jgi:hypothetical protein
MVMRKFIFVPLLLSLPVALPLSVAGVFAAWAGWTPGVVSDGATTVVDAVAAYPACFVIAVVVSWAVLAVSQPLALPSHAAAK